MNYPYLGTKKINGKDVVIMFTGENEGTVVMSDVESFPDYKFGVHGNSYNEDEFEFFSPDSCVRLNN